MYASIGENSSEGKFLNSTGKLARRNYLVSRDDSRTGKGETTTWLARNFHVREADMHARVFRIFPAERDAEQSPPIGRLPPGGIAPSPFTQPERKLASSKLLRANEETTMISKWITGGNL